jgi:signal transduction histidine kinase
MQERVGQVGGTLTIESSSQEGTTIFVRIPLGQDEAVNAAAYDTYDTYDNHVEQTGRADA